MLCTFVFVAGWKNRTSRLPLVFSLCLGHLRFLSPPFSLLLMILRSFSLVYRYSWRTTEWSDCRVDALLSQQDRRRGNQTGLCGGGLQIREAFCVQANAELLSYLNNLKNKEGTGNKDLILKISRHFLTRNQTTFFSRKHCVCVCV